MAAKNPADLKKEGDTLKSLLAKVRKKQHNCAVLVAKDGIVIEVHIKKSPEILLKAAKKNGGTMKGVWGTMNIDGKVMIIDPINDKVPGTLSKLMKKHFSERGLSFRVEIKEPEESASTDKPKMAEKTDSPPQKKGAGPEGENANKKTGAASEPRAEIEKALAKLQPAIDVLNADKKNIMFPGLESGLLALTLALEDAYFDRAKDALGKISSVLDDYEGLMAQKRPLLERHGKLASKIGKISSGEDAEATESIGKHRRAFEYALEKNEWLNAEQQLEAIEEIVKNSANAQPENTEAGEDVKPPEGSPPTDDDNLETQRDAIGKRLKSISGDIRKALKVEARAKELGDLVITYGDLIKGDDMNAARAALDVVEKRAKEINGSDNADKKNLTPKQRDQLKKKMGAMKKELESLKNELNDIANSDEDWELEGA